MNEQQELPFKRGRGGRRKGAGRRRGTRASHHARPRFEKPTPVHVTVRVRRHVWNLRSRRCHRRIAHCLEEAVGRFGLRVIEYSVLGNHIHLIVEADDAQALSRGMQGLSIRIAKSLNTLMNLRGGVFDDHYDGRLLTTPTELVRAIAYVLRNHEHHYGSAGRDPFSSDALRAPERQAQLSVPISWLLRSGWLRASAADRRRLNGTAFIRQG
jgi:putative transposase